MGLLFSDFCQSPREQMYVAPEGRAGTQEWMHTWTQHKGKKICLRNQSGPWLEQASQGGRGMSKQRLHDHSGREEGVCV